jgi:uncharacterized protein YdaU (DUF1376 family)
VSNGRKREKNPWVRWWHGDILSDGFVSGLSIFHEGAYRRLLDYNARDGCIPRDTEALARLCKVTPEEFAPIWAVIGQKFVPKVGREDRLTNPRMEEELSHQQDMHEKRVRAGQKTKNRSDVAPVLLDVCSPFAPVLLQQSSTESEAESESEKESKQEQESGVEEEAQPPAEASTKNTKPHRDEVFFDRQAAAKDSDFVGPGVERILARCREYEAEFGKAWCNSTWDSAVEHVFDEKVEKKLWSRFLLKWFRNEAKWKREKRNA